MREFDEELEVTLSGGGFRASAFGLGVLLYLAHSGLNKRVVTISSVSGGSITNGFIAHRCDFASLQDDKDFTKIAASLAQKISGKGKFRGFWLVSRLYLGLLAISGAVIIYWATTLAVTVLAQLLWNVTLRSVTRNEVYSFFLASIVWGFAALLRGEVIRKWISSTFFDGKPKTLKEVSGLTADNVLCATDLTTSRPFFFSTKGGGLVFGEKYGRGDGSDVRMDFAVGASAAFPSLIPPMRLTLKDRQFKNDDPVPLHVYLSDGGVWNNLGTDWSRLRKSARPDEQHASSVKNPMGGVLLIANASMPSKRQNLFLIKVPVVSFIIALIRVLNVASNSTVVGRSTEIEETARLRMLNDPNRWALGPDAPRPKGAARLSGRDTSRPLAVVIEMTRRPGETASAYKMVGGLTQWVEKADAYARDLEAPLQDLEGLLEGDDVIATTFDSLGSRDTLRMIVLGYLNTRETLSVAFTNHKPPQIPRREWFEKLLQPAAP